MKTLNQIINFAIVAALLIAFGFIYANQRSKTKIAENNLAAQVVYHDRQIDITKRQAKELYGKTIDSLSQALKIRPKQITHWIKGEVKYKDTGSVVIETRPGDTVLIYPDSITGHIATECYNLDLLLYKGIFYETLNYHDSLTMVLSRERPHQFLFIKYGRWIHKASILSKCS